MAEANIPQADADLLFTIEKIKANNDPIAFPAPGSRVSIPLTTVDKRETFSVDFSRSQIRLTKATFQNRARQVIILRRLDLDGPPHRNPDGTEVPCPHLHEYREGFADKWAVAAPSAVFTATSDLNISLAEFLSYCNVTSTPPLQGSLI